MEQARIGKFIHVLRREKGLTQRELADRLGVTDRAISKWENGRGLPEVSLMKPLCDALGITINELLNGEKIKQEDYLVKSEHTFLDTMDSSDRKIRRKNILLWSVTILVSLLIVAAILTVYVLPVTRAYFQPNEDICILYVHKTIPIIEDGQMPDRHDYTNYIWQNITEKIDIEQLMELLPLMRVSVGSEQSTGYWSGDVTYEIFGYFKSGPRVGKSFRIYLGDWNYLTHHSREREYRVLNSEIWLSILERLEGWTEEVRETIQPSDRRPFSIFYQGTSYNGQGHFLDITSDAVNIGSVQSISSMPNEELECSFGLPGNIVFAWTEGENSYVAVELTCGLAYGIIVDMN